VLLAGEVLRDGDVQVLPEVVAQAPVQVRVVVGRIALEKPGTALADARQGETVRVRVGGSTRTLSGRVVARNLVVMEGSE
jgi:flagella basal body P-ring formation protein FlgA